MKDLAQKLINLHGGKAKSQVATAIFGTASQLTQNLDARPRVRIGLWPCIMPESPRVAMGIMTVLGFLLERWQDIRVYRLFAALEGDPKAYEWTPARSQFDVDDWQLDQLDENVALWGTLAEANGAWTLELQLENDLADGEEVSLSYTAENLMALINLLPTIANDIARNFDIRDATGATYTETEASDSSLRVLLGDLFEWQTWLLLSLWGKPWPENEIRDHLNKLIDAGGAVGGALGAWSVANAAAHAMLPGYDAIPDSIVPYAPRIVENFADTSFPAISIGSSLYRMGYAQQAFDLLESDVEARPENAPAWLALAELYRASGRIAEAVDTFQRAIENEATTAGLLIRYANLLMFAHSEDWPPEEYILIDPEAFSGEFPVREAIEAYREAYKLRPERADILSQMILLMIDIEAYENLWDEFKTLVEADEIGENVRTVADTFYNVDDLEPGILILRQAIEANPNRADLLVNLAVTYIMADESDLAINALERAEEMAGDDEDELLADIDRLLLTAEDPDFEARLGEIAAIANAGQAISTSDVKFLEDIIENAPSLAESYVLLAKAYIAWGEHDTALETLLDGHENNPEDGDIIEMLVRTFWDSGEHELAFEYINKGIDTNPNHVPLLALAGECLFEDGQRDSAKVYLARAEAIAPRHPALNKAKANIAQILSRGG